MILRQAYRRVETGTGSAAYPHGQVAYRPMLRVVLHYHSNRFPMLAIVDTGADFSVFPAEVGKSADCHIAPVTLVIND